jgi:hypothetical protein
MQIGRENLPSMTTQHKSGFLLSFVRVPQPDMAAGAAPLIAQELEDISVHQVWRALRNKGIGLERRRSRCISKDPEFTAKASDIAGLYLSPPEGALVISADRETMHSAP